MTLPMLVALLAHGAVAVFLIAVLIVQEATLPEPNWKTFPVSIVGALLWPIVIIVIMLMALFTQILGWD